MDSATVTIDTSDDDVTRNLARVLLVCQIASTTLGCFMLFEIIDRGSLSYRLGWHWNRYKKQLEWRRRQEKAWRQSVGRMLVEADETLRAAS